MSQHGVVVGVTGEQDDEALRFAAEQAARMGAQVTLVHAVHLALPPPPPSPLMTSGPLVERGRDIVLGAAAQFERISGDRCQTMVEEAAPAVALTQLSESADLVVLGHRHRHAVGRLLTRSTTFAVAAHTHCPVVAVPRRGESVTAREDVVTVGAHEDGVPDGVLRAAFELASQRGARLQVVHAWRLDPAYDDLIAGRVYDRWTSEVEEGLRSSAERFAEEFPKVEVDVAVRHEWPANALVAASASSMVLVIGRHKTHARLPMRLGSMARTVLDRAEGPVVVVPT